MSSSSTFPFFQCFSEEIDFPNTQENSKISYGFDGKQAKVDDFGCFTWSHYI